MARKPARVTTHFVELFAETLPCGTVRLYAVEERQGRTRRTIGRVDGGGRTWMALGVGAQAWTTRHPTRAAAVAALRAGEDWRTV